MNRSIQSYIAMSFIELKPMRMSEIPSTPSDTKKTGKYMPPNLRGSHISKPVEVAVDMTTMDGQNFPALGSSPKKVIAWGKHIIRPSPAQAVPETQIHSPVKVVTLSDKIQEKLRKDLLDDEEKAQSPETDILRMSDKELSLQGWDIIPLRKSIASPSPPLHTKFVNSPLGMSFYDYSYYLTQRPVMKISRKTLPNVPVTVEEDDESDYEDSSSFEINRSRHEIW